METCKNCIENYLNRLFIQNYLQGVKEISFEVTFSPKGLQGFAKFYSSPSDLFIIAPGVSFTYLIILSKCTKYDVIKSESHIFQYTD